MQNIDSLIQTVYDETGVLGELTVKFDPLAGEWICRIQESGMDWLDSVGEWYLVSRDWDLDSAMQKLNQLCARQTAASVL